MAITNGNQFLAGYTVLNAGQAAPESGVFIPARALGIDPGELSDIRSVAFGLSRSVYSSFAALSDKDKPVRFQISRATPIGLNESMIRQAYTYSFDLGLDNAFIVNEPGNDSEVL